MILFCSKGLEDAPWAQTVWSLIVGARRTLGGPPTGASCVCSFAFSLQVFSVKGTTYEQPVPTAFTSKSLLFSNWEFYVF